MYVCLCVCPVLIKFYIIIMEWNKQTVKKKWWQESCRYPYTSTNTHTHTSFTFVPMCNVYQIPYRYTLPSSSSSSKEKVYKFNNGCLLACFVYVAVYVIYLFFNSIFTHSLSLFPYYYGSYNFYLCSSMWKSQFREHHIHIPGVNEWIVINEWIKRKKNNALSLTDHSSIICYRQ